MRADRLDELVDSLLWEGYALYPYTPSATKNATPTPFGVVYPPAYAAGASAAHDHLQCQVIAETDRPGAISAEVRYLRAEGDGHRASEHRVALAGPGARAPVGGPRTTGVAELSCRLAGPGRVQATVRVENHTPVDPGTPRDAALLSSLISTHVVLRAEGARFTSPLEAPGCVNVNTWPVLATDDDDVVLGAALILSDHPELAPESRGSLYDGTEIEEALLLHVLALSDDERAQIAAADPAVREMVARAAAAAPEELMRLHGVMRPAGER